MILAIWASVALAYGSTSAEQRQNPAKCGETNGTEVVLGFGDARHGKLPPSLFLPQKELVKIVSVKGASNYPGYDLPGDFFE